MMKRHTRRAIVLAAITSMSGWAAAATVTWTGSASTSWNTASNWDAAALPSDIAAFTNTGITSGATITLDAPQVINGLSLDTTTAFTIGNSAGNTAGHTLTLSALSRSSSSSGVQAITSDIVLPGDSTWDIAGSNYLSVAKVSGTGAITKQGGGEVRFVAAQTAFQRTAATTINEGSLSITGAMQIGSGALTIGDGTHAATCYFRWGNNYNFNALGDSAAVTVRNAGVFDLESYYSAAGGRSESIGSLNVEPGALVKLGKFQLMFGGQTTTNVTLKGGIISGTSGGLAPLSGFVTVDAAATEMPVINAGVALRQQYASGNIYTRFNTNDVAALPVDLKVTGAMVNGWDNRDGFDKLGAGVMKITGSSTYGGRSISEGATRVQAGTLLVDNTSGSGTGSSYVSVSGGAKLGGIGTIGGLASATNANVNLAGANASTLATIAPGTIDESSGAHILGTLTVGSATQNNNVTLGNYSQLMLQLGNSGNGDKLAVVGNLSLNSGLASDALTLLSMPGATLSGEYTLASFTGTLSGRFDGITLDAAPLGSASLQYRDATNQVVSGTADIAGGGSIVLVVPEPASMLLAAGMAVLPLLSRRRSV